MTVTITRVLTEVERWQMMEDAVAKGWYRNDRRMFTPGMAWFQPWYWLPAGWETPSWWPEGDRLPYFQNKRGTDFLSIHYWQTWADKRPPIEVVLPNGECWEVDRKSSNGTGWVITGDLPRITATPSILAKGYHGFLQNGSFTPDCDRPGQPNGVWPWPE